MTESVATTTATLHCTCLRHIPISAAPPPRMTSSFASDAPPTGRHRAWNFPYNGWILLSDSDQSEESRGLVGLSSARSSRFAQSEQSSLHVVDGHPRGVTKGRRRFLYHNTSSDDSGCGSAKVCLSQLCRMPKENDPGLRSTPHCEDDSEVLPTYSTEARGHLHVEHGLPRCGREHSRRFCGRLRRAKR